ncbi:MAG: DUF488 family protein [Candidatus Rhabdochlamydia sp.]
MKPVLILSRVYDPCALKGYRVLVDRLWPRGVSKQQLNLDAWWKELIPSSSLRQWFHHDPSKWDVFKEKYLEELSVQENRAKALLQEALQTSSSFILLYGAKDPLYFHAKILKDYLEKLLD